MLHMNKDKRYHGLYLSLVAICNAKSKYTLGFADGWARAQCLYGDVYSSLGFTLYQGIVSDLVNQKFKELGE